jgi:hypothetical protein
MELVKESLLKAGAATALILLIGFLVGLQADDARVDYLEKQIEESTIRSQTFVVTGEYLSDSSKNFCRVVSEQIPEVADENADIGQNLESFSGKSLSNHDQYEYLKKRYYINQLRLYNLISDYRERCSSNVTTVFYFFDSSIQSQRQGSVLTQYRRETENTTYVFSYNLDTDNSTVLEILKSDYEIDEGPAIVVNGNQTYRRYVGLKELKKVMSNQSKSD